MAGRAHVHVHVRMRRPLAAVAPRFAHVLWIGRFDVSFRRASTTSPLHTFVFHRLPFVAHVVVDARMERDALAALGRKKVRLATRRRRARVRR